MFAIGSSFEGSLVDEFRRIEGQLDQLFGTTAWPKSIRAAERGAYPPINIGSSPEQVDVYLFIAGVEAKDLDISIQMNLLTLAGRRNLTNEDAADYYRQERFDGEFRRVVTLPEDVDPDKVDASYRDGVLHVSIKRRESSRPRRIEIN